MRRALVGPALLISITLAGCAAAGPGGSAASAPPGSDGLGDRPGYGSAAPEPSPVVTSSDPSGPPASATASSEPLASAAASPRPSASASAAPSASKAPSAAPSASPRPSAAASPKPSPSASPRPSASAAPSPLERAEVEIEGFAFTPATIQVAAGQEIRWRNRDAATHTVTFAGGSVNSGSLGDGDTFSHAFAAQGTYPYACAIHPSMTGTVVVQ